MARLKCSDCGFVCEFNTKGNVKQITSEFETHMNYKHRKDYSKNTL